MSFKPEQDQALRGTAVTLHALRDTVGNNHVLTTDPAMRRFTRGYRYGQGHALAVIRPGRCLSCGVPSKFATPPEQSSSTSPRIQA